MKEYLNRHKVFRIMAYMIDIGILLILCMWIMPMFDAISPQLVYQQIARVHDAVDMSIMQEETMILMSYIERCTMMFALLGCIYDSILLSVFETTIGKAIFGLSVTCEETITWKRRLQMCLRSILKRGYAGISRIHPIDIFRIFDDRKSNAVEYTRSYRTHKSYT